MACFLYSINTDKNEKTYIVPHPLYEVPAIQVNTGKATYTFISVCIHRVKLTMIPIRAIFLQDIQALLVCQFWSMFGCVRNWTVEVGFRVPAGPTLSVPDTFSRIFILIIVQCVIFADNIIGDISLYDRAVT